MKPPVPTRSNTPTSAQDVSRLRDFYNANLLLARPNAPLRMGQVDGTVAHRAPMPPPRLHNCSLHNVLLGDAVVLEVRS